MTDAVKKFLEKVQAIAATKPSYRQPGDGSDGTCDCIGLIIGAIRRMGLKWDGIHGCNWAARREFVQLQRISSTWDLQVGDVVLKAYEPGSKGWKLPKRYQKGGAYYDGNLKDYYHAGVVLSASPLRIVHMTSPTIKEDTSLGKWGYHGQLRILAKAAGAQVPSVPAAAEPTPAASTPTTGKTARVVASSGKWVKMRQQPTQKCRLYDDVPIGATVTLEAPGETWARISYGKRKGWYMMAKYLEVQED